MSSIEFIVCAPLWVASSCLFIAWFNSMIEDEELEVLARLNRWQRIAVRLAIIIVWPMLFVIAMMTMAILALNWLWSNLIK